jgi:hypothetical protein
MLENTGFVLIYDGSMLLVQCRLDMFQDACHHLMTCTELGQHAYACMDQGSLTIMSLLALVIFG